MSEFATAPPRLRFFPVSFFAMVMGLSGLAIAWERAQHSFPLPVPVGQWLSLFSLALFLLLLGLYLYKLARYRAEVLAELRHPVKLSFFPTISISLILLSVALLHHQPDLARGLWLAGTGLHLILTLYVMNVWMHHEHFEIHHINPAWFIPVVGNVLVPLTGVPLGLSEPSWFFFSIGILFWLVLLTIIFYRMLFHRPLPERLMPTFFILIAPPAVGFLAYLQLTGELNAFARVLYYSGLFLTLLLATQAARFLRLNFFLSWWAYSFPLAAITVATLVMGEKTGLTGFAGLGGVLLVILNLIVLFLFLRTLWAILGRQVCVPET